jgi:hypothetical protein
MPVASEGVVIRRAFAAVLDALIAAVEWYDREQAGRRHPLPDIEREDTKRIRVPPPPVSDLMCRHNALLNQRCLKCEGK